MFFRIGVHRCPPNTPSLFLMQTTSISEIINIESATCTVLSELGMQLYQIVGGLTIVGFPIRLILAAPRGKITLKVWRRKVC